MDVFFLLFLVWLVLWKSVLLEDKRCWKCKGENGTFLHAFWECPVVLPFWKEVLRKLGDWLERLPESPLFCLLGDSTLLPQGVNKGQHALLTAGLITAARLILRNWKKGVYGVTAL
uniref:Reverse transcriptase zinc-binding domain-containing protein n=1 Tax=Sander lucioperca TaxID=283035 RepID=A0A8C9XF99_SANLU